MLTQFQESLKTALKSGDKPLVQAYRNILAKIKARQIEKREPLTETEVQQILQSYAKQLKDSIDQYNRAGREDLVEKETFELTIVEKYLPTQLSEAEIRAILQEIIEEQSATTLRDLGKVMPVAMQRLVGRADGKQVQQLVRELLG